jgi:putative transposase
MEASADLYNAALEQRRDAWRKQRVFVDLYDQQRQLTDLRASMPEWADIPLRVERSVLRRLDRAFRGFFRRVRNGESPGYPRFRSRARYDSITLPVGGKEWTRVVDDRIVLPRMGPVRFRRYRELRGKPLELRLHRSYGRWYVSIVCDLGDAPAKIPVRNAVGIDLGLTTFATLSNGEEVANPRFLRSGEDLLARRQRSLARKRRGSNSRHRAKRLVARAHEHVRNQRIDFARKEAKKLFDRFDMIAYEDLQVARMVHGNLAKSIYDASWTTFIHALTCKAEEAGKWCVSVDPRGTTQRCSGCDKVVHKDLSQREHRCDGCGLVLGRDENAARNVLALGLSAGLLTEASSEVWPYLMDKGSGSDVG